MDLLFYDIYKRNQNTLRHMQRLYYAEPRRCTSAQAEKFETIRAGLLADLRQIYPEAKDSGTPLYLIAAIERVLQNQREAEKEAQERMRANGASARTQLKAWDWPGLK